MKSKAVVSRYRTEFTEAPRLTPADTSVDGPLLGNGDMGVAIAGTSTEHHYILCKNDLWRLEHAYGRSCPVPLGQLSIVLKGFTDSGYLVTQDIYTATTTGTFQKPDGTATLTSYVAATRNLLLVEIAAYACTLHLLASLTVSGGRGAETQTGRTGYIYWGTRAFTGNVDLPTAAAAAWTLTEEGRLRTDGSFTVTPGRPVTLVLSLESSFQHEDYLAAAQASIRDLATVRRNHLAWWAEYWEKSYVCIDDPVIE